MPQNCYKKKDFQNSDVTFSLILQVYLGNILQVYIGNIQ